MKNILALLYATLFMISCSSGFNPRYYYGKNKKLSGSSGIVNNTPVTPPDQVEADKDPFKVGEWNDINYGGYDGNVFDSWLFKASFQNDKLPIYNFFTDSSRRWTPGGKDWNNISPANYYNPKDKENEASGYGITGSTIYKYDGANPLYDNTGYLPGRMDRFRFYSLYGNAVVVSLQQYLIAVDTYSKLVFAFGKITKVDSVLGQKVPMEFRAIEFYADRIPFYEYDPIGYVKDNGEVVLYEHYRKEFVENPTGYLPKQHSNFDTVATHTPNGQGYSPYLPSDNPIKYLITIKAKELKNVSVKSREKVFGIQGDPKNYAAFTYSIAGIAYDSSIPIDDLDIIENRDPRSESMTGMIYWSEVYTLDLNKTVTFNSSKQYKINSGGQINIDLASRVDKYNKETGFADTAKFGSNGSGEMSKKDSPKLRLKYDAGKDAFVVDSSGSINHNSSTSTSITYDNNFTLKKGEGEKDITIRYNWKKGNDTSNGEEFEITYTLKFEEIIE